MPQLTGLRAGSIRLFLFIDLTYNPELAMATLDTFRTLQKDAEDKKYPHDNTKLRPAHAEYAREILVRVKAQEG